MPIYVGLVNWTDQGTREFRGSVERANGFRGLAPIFTQRIDPNFRRSRSGGGGRPTRGR